MTTQHTFTHQHATQDHEFGLIEDRSALGTAMAALGERDRTIVTLRFYEDLSQSEIAVRVGVSQMDVSRMITGALLRLHREIDPEGC